MSLYTQHLPSSPGKLPSSPVYGTQLLPPFTPTPILDGPTGYPGSGNSISMSWGSSCDDRLFMSSK